MKNYFNFYSNRNSNSNATAPKKSNQVPNSGNGKNSSFLKKLLALILTVIACAFCWSGIMIPYPMAFINILLVISGIFIILICSDLIDQINRFGKYNDDSDRCNKDHSDGINGGYGGSNDYGYGSDCNSPDYGNNNYPNYDNDYPYGKYQDNDYYRSNDYQINSCPNNDYSDYRKNDYLKMNDHPMDNQNEFNYPNPENKPQQPKNNGALKPNDKDYSQLED